MKKILLGLLILLMSKQALFSQTVQKEVKNFDEKMKQALLQSACEARKKAYAPYSHYFVGSAILTNKGTIFQGSNIENASYGLTCCSERIAVFKAVSEGVTDFIALALVTKGGGFPCGACRQVLNEFSPNMLVFIGDENGNLLHETTLAALLPNAFGPYNLD